jgi:dipeptidyl-peptidase-4
VDRTTRADARDPRHGDRPSFPRLAARTARFTLGVPESFTISPDGLRVVFLRSRSGTDSRGLLWCLDVETGSERLLLDPSLVLGSGAEQLSDTERARRERLRESAAGVTAYATDESVSRAVVVLSGRLVVVRVADGTWIELPTPGAAVDPHLSPDGSRVAFYCDGGVFVTPSDGSGAPRRVTPPLTSPSEPTDPSAAPAITWGLADFVHAEELGRSRGFWFSPSSPGLLVTRVDETQVVTWHTSDPSLPQQAPRPMRYPAAGTANPRTSLWWIVGPADTDLGAPPVQQLTWDHEAFPYLVAVRWQRDRPALVTVLSRDQQRMRVLSWLPRTGDSGSSQVELTTLTELHDSAWVHVVPGTPAWLGDRLLTVRPDATGDSYHLLADDEPLLAGLHVRAVHVQDHREATAVVMTDRTRRRVVRLTAEGDWSFLDDGGGLSSGVSRAGTTVLRSDSLNDAVSRVAARRSSMRTGIRSLAQTPPFVARPTLLQRQLDDDPHVAVLLPRDPDAPHTLPVLLDPYGGPHGQRVVDSGRAFLEAQWWADQGFLVVVADGPGTPGSPRWERAMAGSFARPALAAQVRALEMLKEQSDQQFSQRADRSRVAIRGWSFGGYLAALAVLERPDVFHAAIAGAPVTDWRLYDTAYTERYLGHPADHPTRYDEESLLTRADQLRRPLMLIHGTSDDNVVVAHTLRLSARLLSSGRAHTVLPLSGVTHMTPQEAVAENLLLVQRDFLRDALSTSAAARASETEHT